MTPEQAKKLFDGARLHVDGGEYALSVLGVDVDTSLETSAFRLYCKLEGRQAITGITVDIGAPERWPPERVLRRLQRALDEGWRPPERLVLGTEPDPSPS